MKMFKILGVVLITGVIMTFGSDMVEQFSVPVAQGLVPNAEAIVGRPLTPVSVAGVARRSVRRCAVGVYRCSLTEPQPSDSQLGQTSTESIRHQAASCCRLNNEQRDAAVDRS